MKKSQETGAQDETEAFSFQVFHYILERIAIRRSLLPEERFEHQVRTTRQLNGSGRSYTYYNVSLV